MWWLSVCVGANICTETWGITWFILQTRVLDTYTSHKPFSSDCGWKHRSTHECEGGTDFLRDHYYDDWRNLEVYKDSSKFIQLNGRLHLISRELHVQAEMQSRIYLSILQVRRSECIYKMGWSVKMSQTEALSKVGNAIVISYVYFLWW
jgi:hypothetical protein